MRPPKENRASRSSYSALRVTFLLPAVVSLVLGGCDRGPSTSNPGAGREGGGDYAVVGYSGVANLFDDAELTQGGTEIELGTRLEILDNEGDILHVRTTTGHEGWTRRCWVCPQSELARRRAEDDLPEQVVCVRDRDGRTQLYGGSLSIRNGGLVLMKNDTVWLDSTMRGKDFSVAGSEVVGDPSVMFLYKGGGDISRLETWPEDTGGVVTAHTKSPELVKRELSEDEKRARNENLEEVLALLEKPQPLSMQMTPTEEGGKDIDAAKAAGDRMTKSLRSLKDAEFGPWLLPAAREIVGDSVDVVKYLSVKLGARGQPSVDLIRELLGEPDCTEEAVYEFEDHRGFGGTSIRGPTREMNVTFYLYGWIHFGVVQDSTVRVIRIDCGLLPDES